MATSNTMEIELAELKSKADVTGRRSIPVPLIENRTPGQSSRFIVLLAIVTVCHFAAWEQPQLFSAELRAAFRSLR